MNNNPLPRLDGDPVFCEIAIRRLENFRRTGRLGWQNDHPFAEEYTLPSQSDDADATVVATEIRIEQPSLF